MASETDTRSPSPDHVERKRHSDSDNELSDRKKSHFNADGSFYFKILVPSVAAGAIIGKGGETIAQMQKEFNTKIKMSKANDFYPGTTERVCLVKGSLDGILAMLNFIMEKIREKPDPNAKPAMDFDSKTPAERDKQVKILVPNSTAGMIIGKGGGYIKQIKEESGAYLQISQKAKDQALQERCITVIGEMENNKKACQMILAKIAEDPQSGSCLNVSYADVTGPVANFNPTGSPYAQNGTGSNTPAYPPVHSSHSNGHGSTYTNLGVNLNIGLGFQPPNASLLGQVLDHVRSSLRSAGYVDLVSAEIINAITTLATYGMLGVGVGFNGSAVSESSQSWVNSSHAPEPGIASSSPGPFGPIGSSPHRYSEASYDPFRRAFNNPLPLNNNSFGLGSPQSPPIGPEHLHNEIVNSSPRSEPTRAEMQVGEHIVGAILGPGGKALLEIQHFSGANIQISKKGVYAPGTRNRWVTIYGTPNAISTAQYLIEQRISEEEAKRARNNHSSLNSSTHFSAPPSAAVLH